MYIHWTFSVNVTIMPSTWKYLCCGCCDLVDNKHTRESLRYKRQKTSKNTWTRRKLLETDNDTSYDHSDQMRTITDTPIRGLDDDCGESFEERILDHFAPKKRPTIHDVFDTENETGTRSAQQTTFPWMDDRFAPNGNGRTRTRLGVSSVKMNVKMNEVRNNTASENININRHVDAGSHAASDLQKLGINSQIYRNDYQIMRSNSKQTNLKQNGHVIRNNIVTAPKITAASKEIPVRHVVSINNNNKPMLFKESSSDVGVRRIITSSHQNRPNRIPKLDDYSHANGQRYYKDSSSDIGPYRPKSQSAFHKVYGANEGDISFSSEVTFRQHPSMDSSRDLSMKRSPAPGIFTSKGSKYERIKSGKSKSKTGHDQNMPESMYGYVPKVVQDVQASNALEGTQIDDFFIKLFHNRQNDRSALLEDAELENTDEVPMIITTIDSKEDLTKLTKECANHTNSLGIGITTGQNITPSVSGKPNRAAALVYANNNTNADTNSSGIKVNGSTKKVDKVTTFGDKTDEIEDQVIMIDFPPNLEKDKLSIANIKLNQTKSAAQTSMIKINENNAIKKREEVLY